MNSAMRIGLVLAVGLAGALPAGAQAAVLHDQTNDLGFYKVPSDDYVSAQDSLDNQLADDFTVPPGQVWTISQVDLLGESPPSGLTSVVNAWIYGSAGTIPGAEAFHQVGITAANQPNYSVQLSGAPGLGTGTYWISVQQTGANYAAFTWAWSTRETQDGNPSVFRNPGGGYVAGACLDWTPTKDCFPPVAPDLAWSISGKAKSAPVTLGKLKRLRNGTALLAVGVPAPGSLTLGGKGVKGSSAQVAAREAASTVTLRIRAKGKAKKTLRQTGKVTVKAKITYTNPGAEPTTSKRKVKLATG